MPLRSLTPLFALLVLACGGASEPAADASPAAPEAASASAPSDAPADRSAPEATDDDPCALLTKDDIAAALGTEVALVGDGGPGPFPHKNAKDCVWDVNHDGIEDTVTLWMRFRNEKTAPDGWSRAIEGYISNGETIGSNTLTHVATDLGGVSGALSDIYGSKYVKARIFSWQINEEILYRLTISRSLDEAETLPDPPTEAFESLVTAALQ